MKARIRLAAMTAILSCFFSMSVMADPVIWDNGASNPIVASTSQFDANFSSQTADDFVLPAGPGGEPQWLITGIRWRGSYQDTTFPPDASPPMDAQFDFNILFYTDNGTGNAPTGGTGDPTPTALQVDFLPNADVNETFLGTPDGSIANFSYEATLNAPFLADASTKYWLSVQSVGDRQPQWFWNGSTSQQLHQGVIGFVPTGIHFWTNLSQVIQPNPIDLSFELTGVPVPEPTTAALLMSGLLLVGRCRPRRRT